MHDSRLDATLPTRREAILPQGASAVVAARGAIAGCFGAGTVAIWFLVIDALTRTPMWSPSVVGAAVLRGQPASTAAGVDLSMVAAFSLVHVVLFMAFGVAATLTMRRFAVRSASMVAVAGLAIGLQAGFVALAVFIAPGIGDALGWATVSGGNLAAAISMSVCLEALPEPGDAAEARVSAS